MLLLKKAAIAISLVALTACNGALNTKPGNAAADPRKQSVEAQAGLVSFVSSKPYFHKGKIVEYAYSGVTSKEELAKGLYSEYFELRLEHSTMFSPEWLAPKLKHGYTSDRDRIETDLQFYQVYSSEKAVHSAKALVQKARVLKRNLPSGAEITVSMLRNPLLFEEDRLEFKNSDFIFQQPFDTVYKLKGATYYTGSPIWWNYFQEIDGDTEYGVRGYYKVDGGTHKFKISSLNNRLRIDRSSEATLGNYYEFRKPGAAKVRFSIAGKSHDMDLNVIEIPVKQMASVDMLIKTLGLPDQQKTYYTSWPCGRSVNRFFYEPSAAQRIVAPEHWMYDAYPNMVLEVSGGMVTNIETLKENKLSRATTSNDC